MILAFQNFTMPVASKIQRGTYACKRIGGDTIIPYVEAILVNGANAGKFVLYSQNRLTSSLVPLVTLQNGSVTVVNTANRFSLNFISGAASIPCSGGTGKACDFITSDSRDLIQQTGKNDDWSGNPSADSSNIKIVQNLAPNGTRSTTMNLTFTTTVVAGRIDYTVSYSGIYNCTRK